MIIRDNYFPIFVRDILCTIQFSEYKRAFLRPLNFPVRRDCAKKGEVLRAFVAATTSVNFRASLADLPHYSSHYYSSSFDNVLRMGEFL